jgi:hypothetical protein
MPANFILDTTKKNHPIADLAVPLMALIAALVLGALLAASGMERGLRPTLLPGADSPDLQVACPHGSYDNGYLLVEASEGSNAFSAYTWKGELVKVHAMPWQFSHDHDLWVEDCVEEIKEAAAAQQ